MNLYLSNKITFLNVLLTFCIVIFHSNIVVRYGLCLDWAYPFIYTIRTLGNIAVPLFFFISGFLFYNSCTSLYIVIRKLRSRIRSLLVPYILWNSIFVLIFACLVNIPLFSSRMNISTDILNTPVKIFSAIINSYHSDLWFVKNLIIYSILSPIIFMLLKNKLVAIGLYISLLISAILSNPDYKDLLNWFHIYIIGAILGYNMDNKYVKYIVYVKKQKLVTILLMLLFFMLYTFALIDESNVKILWYFSPLLIFMLVDGVLYNYISTRFVKLKWMKYMFFIYCTHHFILNILQKIVVLTLPPTNCVLNLTFIVTPIITILFLVGLSNILSKYKFYNILNGGR